MARSKTMRYKKSKKRTMRKPRTLFRVTENNLNLSEDPDVKWNLMSSAMEREEDKIEREEREKIQEANQKLRQVPYDTFLFQIIKKSRYIGWNEVINDRRSRRFIPQAFMSGARYRNWFEKVPFRAMDFLRLVNKVDISYMPDYSEVENIFETADIFKILYKGLQPEENYFCLVKYSTVMSPEKKQYRMYQYYIPDEDKPDGFWDVYFFPASDFFKPDSELAYPAEPNRFFPNRGDLYPFFKSLPYLQEKAAKEESALDTWRESILRHQRRVVEPMAAKFMKETKQVVPENVEHIIRSFI